MSDDILISFDELEAKEDGFLFTGREEESDILPDYNLRIVERELILLCSLLLTAPEAFVKEEDSWDILIVKAKRIERVLLEHTASYKNYYLRSNETGDEHPPTYLGEEQLPDVCGGCFRTVGFCAGGSVRYRCRECYGKTKHPRSLQGSPKRNSYAWRFHDIFLVNAILAQLIYKYHSPNGDKQWTMKSLMS